MVATIFIFSIKRFVLINVSDFQLMSFIVLSTVFYCEDIATQES